MVAVMIQTLSEGTMPSLAYTLHMQGECLHYFILDYTADCCKIFPGNSTFIFNFLKFEHLFTIGMYQELIEHRSVFILIFFEFLKL